MKRFILCLLFLWAVWALAVVPADYYIPLQVGNQLVYRSDDDIEGSGGWSSRTVFETIEGTDTLFEHIYYKQVGSEFLDDSPYDEHVFHVFWLREDSLGNILIGAMGMGDSSRLLDSALIYPMEYIMFFAERYEPGYSMHASYMGMDCLDSTISNTVPLSTNAGDFSNCVKMMSQRIDTVADSLAWEEYVYYAKDVGEVLKERIYPDPHYKLLAHINFQTNIEESIPQTFRLGQNYPNPFNPLTTIEYELPEDAFVSISIYDIKGKKINALVNMRRNAGYHKVIWNAMDLSSGVYIYTLEVDHAVIARKKLCLIK